MHTLVQIKKKNQVHLHTPLKDSALFAGLEFEIL